MRQALEASALGRSEEAKGVLSEVQRKAFAESAAATRKTMGKTMVNMLNL